MTTITALPTPPSRQDPTNFNDRADAFLGALPAFATETNAVASELNTASANAVAANQAVIAATNITKWVSGSTYTNGAVVWSPINGLAYRRITTSGSGTTDPSLDTANYKQVNGTGDVSTSGNQTIGGTKTFSNTINGNAATASAAYSSGFYTASTTSDGILGVKVQGQNDAVLFNSASNWGLYSASGGSLIRYDRTGVCSIFEDVITIDSGNNIRSKISGYGSTYPSTLAKAWCNFYGVNAGIRGHSNISSISKFSTGYYRLYLSTSMPDASYSVVASSGPMNSGMSVEVANIDASYFDIRTTQLVNLNYERQEFQLVDPAFVMVAIFR